MKYINMIIKVIEEYIRLLYDTIRYGCNRRMMRRMHKEISGYIVEQIRYLIQNIDYSSNIPNSVDNEGNVNGTMSKQEWLEILSQIEYSLSYDINKRYNNELPENIAEVGEYLNKQEQEEKKYKQGLMLLGRYYSDIWG